MPDLGDSLREKPPALYWTDCPTCGKTVYVVAGSIGSHVEARQARRWPKLGRECPASGQTHHWEPEATQPLLGDV